MVTMKAPNERSESMQLRSVPSGLLCLQLAPVPDAPVRRWCVARPWLAALVALAGLLAVFPASALAEPGVLAVRSKGPAQEKAIAVQAVTEALTRAGWTLTPRTFNPQEVEALVKCLPTDLPWRCLAKATRDATLRRLAVLSLESQPTDEGTLMTVVTVQVASADQQDTAHGGRRYCQPCSPDSLAKLTAEAAAEVLEWMHLKSGKTFLEVKSRPLGAIVSVDGKRLGVTDAAFPIMPGPHRVVVTHPKYQAETRTIEVKENKTAVVTVVFGPNDAVGGLVDPARAGEFRDRSPPTRNGQAPSSIPVIPPTAKPHQSRRLPTALISAGAVAIVGGVVALAVDEDADGQSPDPQTLQDQTHWNTAPLGVGMLIGGALVAGAGGWLLWRKGSTKPQNRLSAELLLRDGGAAFSLVRSF